MSDPMGAIKSILYPASVELRLERRDQEDKTVHVGRLAVTPAIGPGYWTYRVALTDDQAVVGFPKFNTVGIGFQREDEDWNTNLPYTVDAEQIADHIWENRGSVESKALVVEAIRMIQQAAREDRGDVEAEATEDDTITQNRDLLTEARLNLTQSEDLEAAIGDYCIRTALAQATIVLAEQQRTANKLAYMAAFPGTHASHLLAAEVEQELGVAS